MVAAWIRRAHGLLDIRVRGAELERFLNLCAQERIALYDVRRTELDVLTARIPLRDFYRLARVHRRTRCRVHITRRRGLPFVWKRMRGRYGLWLGALLMCVVCYLLYTRIWMIETQVAQGLNESEILQELADIGVGIGTKRTDIDARAVKLYMLREREELKYFSVNVEGNVLTVQAAAATEPPENEQAQGVHSVVARRDGIIRKLSVHRGTQQCKPGDAVIQGQVLVDALVEKTENRLDETRLVDANATVWADTRYFITRKMALETQKKTARGKAKTRYALCFGKTRINLYRNSSLTDGLCDRITMVKTVHLNAHLVLPVSLCCETVTPYETEPVRRTAKDVQARLEYGARRSAERQLTEGNLTSMQADVTEENGAAVLRAVVWCYEEIAERVEDGRTAADLPEDEAPDTE